jgi:hypothetical protein
MSMNHWLVMAVLGLLAGFVIAQVIPRTTYAQGTVTPHVMLRTLSGSVIEQPPGGALQGARIATCFTYGSDGIFCVPGQ